MATAGLTLTPGNVFAMTSKETKHAKGEKVKIAYIGIGNRGEQNINELKKEYFIPYAVDILMKERGYKCEVLSTDSHWFGVTYKEDRPGVVAKFQELVDKGVYPTPLWKK